MFPGCGRCCAATWEEGLLSDWSDKQRLAFYYSWQQRFVICTATTSTPESIFKASLNPSSTNFFSPSSCRCTESVGGQHGTLCVHPEPQLCRHPCVWGGGREGRWPSWYNIPASPAHSLQTGDSNSRTQHTALPAARTHYTAAGKFCEHKYSMLNT